MNQLHYLRYAVMEGAMACEDSGLLDLVVRLLVFDETKGR